MILIRFPWLHFYFSKALFHTPILPLRNEKQRNIPHFPQRGDSNVRTLPRQLANQDPNVFDRITHLSVTVFPLLSKLAVIFHSSSACRGVTVRVPVLQRWEALKRSVHRLLFVIPRWCDTAYKGHFKVCAWAKKVFCNGVSCHIFLLASIATKGFCELLTVYSPYIARTIPRTPAPVCWRGAEMFHLITLAISLIYCFFSVSFSASSGQSILGFHWGFSSSQQAGAVQMAAGSCSFAKEVTHMVDITVFSLAQTELIQIMQKTHSHLIRMTLY